MHLRWDPAPNPQSTVSVVLEIVEPPVVPRLYFWALQVNFVDGPTRVGGAHLGLQWHPGHPGGTAINWGGYRDRGGELAGDDSLLPSATSNPNTRDFLWLPHRRYRLTISGSGDGWWTGAVTDLATDVTTVVRRLDGGGTALVDPVVWSEVFARCNDPSTTVRWSGFAPVAAGLSTTYQSHRDGGCANTLSMPDGDGWIQVTNIERS